MEYNKEESERQAASQKEQAKMIDSIKASIRDILEQRSSVLQEYSSNLSNMDICVCANKPRMIRIPEIYLN